MDALNYAERLIPASQDELSILPFSHHSQLSVITDILIRKFCHHVHIDTDFNKLMQKPFLLALISYLRLDNINHKLKQANLFYLDTGKFKHSSKLTNDFKHELSQLRELTNNSQSNSIICINLIAQQQDLLAELSEYIFDPGLRFILFNSASDLPGYLEECFASLRLKQAQEADIIKLLQMQATELAEHHKIIINEDTLSEAHQLAKRYLSSGDIVKNCLLLLDSSAARACQHHDHISPGPVKPVLTLATLYIVLSSWTNIPASHLPLNKFASGDFIQALQQRLFGQDIAINLICQKLQHSHAGLQGNNPTFASMLLAGPKFTGKKTTAICLSQQLFSHLNALYFVDLPTSRQLLSDIKVQRQSDKRYLPLKNAIQQTPYAIFLFAELEQAHSNILNQLTDLLSTGIISSEEGSQYQFKQAILLFNTAAGSQELNHLFAPQPASEVHNQLDLMQLVMSQQHNEKRQPDQFTAESIVDRIMGDIKDNLPAALLQHVSIIPYLPIGRDGLEKIIRLKLKDIAQQLERRYLIDLSYAPEVIHFLAEESIKAQSGHDANNIEQALQQLYLSIEQSILFNERRPNRPNQLFLQLNETGEVLRCHWLDSAVSS